MRGCNLPFFKCDLRIGDSCECVKSKHLCTNGLVFGNKDHKGFDKEDIELLLEDTIDWGYSIYGIEEFLIILNKIERKIELTKRETQSLSKFIKRGAVIKPFDLEEAIASPKCDIGAIDLKRLTYSSRVKETNAKQALGYILSICQENNLNPKNYFPVVLNARPFEQKPRAYRPPRWHMLKIKSDSSLVDELNNEIKTTFREQNRLLNSSKQFAKVKKQKEKSKTYPCENCLDHSLCEKVISDMSQYDCTPREYLVDKLKVLPENYHLRWSEINKACTISRIYSKLSEKKLPDHLRVERSKLSKIGNALHAVFNTQHRSDFYHNKTLNHIGVKTVSRDKYCEKRVVYHLKDGKNEIVVTGHADAFFMITYKPRQTKLTENLLNV